MIRTSISKFRWRWLAPLLLSLQVLAACSGQSSGLTPTSAVNAVPASRAASPALMTLASSPAAGATAAATATTVGTHGATTAVPAANATPGTPSAAPTGTPVATAASQPSATTPVSHDTNQDSERTGRKNYVIVRNTKDANLEVRGNVQLNRIPGSTATPENFAYAYSSCTDCQTFAVALQVNLISKDARVIAPQNVALAVNERCTRCYTVARAIQYNVQVDNPQKEPEDVRELLRDMDKTLNELSRDKTIGAAQAEQRINEIVARFRALSASLYDRRDEDTHDDGNPTPSPAPVTTPAVAPTATPSPISTPIPSPINTPTPGGAIPPAAPSRTP